MQHWSGYTAAEPDPRDGHPLSCYLSWDKTTSSAGSPINFPDDDDEDTWDPPLTATTSLTLPIDEASTLFFHSTGSQAVGRIEFVASEEGLDNADEAVVDITARYWNPDVWESAKICKMKGHDGHGLGIYVSRAVSRPVSLFPDAI